MTALKRTQTRWLMRSTGAPALSGIFRLARVNVRLTGILSAVSRLAEERVPLAGSKRR